MNKNIPDIGQDAPDFEVSTSDVSTFKLSEELKSGKNVNLMFYRGHWWPFCIHQFVEIQKNYDTYTKFNTRVFALSTDSPKQSESLIKKSNLSLTLLCDEDRKVVDLFKLRNPFEHDGIAYPATFIINPEGKICYRSIDGTAARSTIGLNATSSLKKKIKKKPALFPSDWWTAIGVKGDSTRWALRYQRISLSTIPVIYCMIIIDAGFDWIDFIIITSNNSL